MLAKLPVILSVWFLLSLVVAWLMGMAISAFQEVPAPGLAPPLEAGIDWQPAAVEEMEKVKELGEVKEEELLILAR